MAEAPSTVFMNFTPGTIPRGTKRAMRLFAKLAFGVVALADVWGLAQLGDAQSDRAPSSALVRTQPEVPAATPAADRVSEVSLDPQRRSAPPASPVPPGLAKR